MIHFKRFSRLKEVLSFINDNGHKLISLGYPQELAESGDLYEYSFKVIYEDTKNPFHFRPQFHDCNITFNLVYQSNGQHLRVGDIIRVYEPDETLTEGLYAIYTWVQHLQVYTFVNESTLYDFCTIDFDLEPDLKESIDAEILHEDMRFENLKHLKPLGNISEEKWCSKLDKNWLVAYRHLFHF